MGQSMAKRPRGLSLSVDAGLLLPNDKQAHFYSGRPGSSNTIDRVIHSEMYGTPIWNSLVSQGLISPSAITSYRAFEIAEYPNMQYQLTYQLGVGIRYDYPSGWGWLFRFDYSKVNAIGNFLLSSQNGIGILGQNQYVKCGILGTEKRVYIDLGLSRRVALTNKVDLELDLGLSINNTTVLDNSISVGGLSYSILDVWGGNTPYSGIGAYEYINEGGIGKGTFASIVGSYAVGGSTFDLGYTLYYTQTLFKGYNNKDAFAFEHVIFVRFNINNFSFLN